MELTEDNDVYLQYHPSQANIMGYSFSTKLGETCQVEETMKSITTGLCC